MEAGYIDPAGAATPAQIKVIGKLERADGSKSPSNNQNLAARWLARHFDLTPCRAMLIADLAGLGVTVAPILPALIGGGQ